MHSSSFFDRVKDGKFTILVSEVVLDELQDAPGPVKRAIEDLSEQCLERVEIDESVNELAEAYIAAGILSEKWRDDAMHVAAATVANADLILSWNFRHIVNFQRIHKFNGINLSNGYSLVDIRSPLEVEYDDED